MSKKSALEKSFEDIGIKAITRRTIDGHDVLLGDGFVRNPYQALKKFGIEEQHFPQGCYVTVWLWAKHEAGVGLGLPLFFEPVHDPNHALSSRQTLRINSAVLSAKLAIRRMKEVRANGQA